MQWAAVILAASCCGLIVALESNAAKDQEPHAATKPAASTEAGLHLFQSASIVRPGAFQDKLLDGAGPLAQEVEATLLEEVADDDASECLQHSTDEFQPATPVQHQAPVLDFHALIESLSLFQDMAWFGLAFIVFFVWRCIADMEKRAAELSKSEEVLEQTEASVSRKAKACSAKPMDVDKLVKAMYSENKDDLRKFLDERSINACDEISCCTALHVAAHYSCIPAAEALLDRGADANIRDAWDETPLHFAARAGNAEVLRLLLTNGADANIANADGSTPLIIAATAKKAEVCELLLDHGAHTGGADEDDLPPMLHSILQRRIMAGI